MQLQMDLQFAIYHQTLRIDGEEKTRQQDLENNDINNVMCAAVAQQHPYVFIFAFVCGAHQSSMDQFSFFKMDQSHTGGVINHYQSTGANDHILCALAGKCAPKQKEIAQT